MSSGVDLWSPPGFLYLVALSGAAPRSAKDTTQERNGYDGHDNPDGHRLNAALLRLVRAELRPIALAGALAVEGTAWASPGREVLSLLWTLHPYLLEAMRSRHDCPSFLVTQAGNARNVSHRRWIWQDIRCARSAFFHSSEIGALSKSVYLADQTRDTCRNSAWRDQDREKTRSIPSSAIGPAATPQGHDVDELKPCRSGLASLKPRQSQFLHLFAPRAGAAPRAYPVTQSTARAPQSSRA